MSHQAPLGTPNPFANQGNQQHFAFPIPRGNFAPPVYPPGLPHPPFAPQFQPQFPGVHPQYAHPQMIMHNPYPHYPGFGAPINPGQVANQGPVQPPTGQVPSVHDGPVQPQAPLSYGAFDAIQAPISQLPAPAPTPVPAAVPAAAAPPPVLKNRPNRELRPGVFIFQVDVLDGENKETLQADTEMSWTDLRGSVVRLLGDPEQVQLSGKISGEGKWSILNGAEGLEDLMKRIIQKAMNARTKAVALEVKNTATAAAKKPKSSGKRSRKDDIPPEIELDKEAGAQYKAFQQLDVETRCEAHHGHCYISRRGGVDSHRRLSHEEMTLWAKKMSLNQATIYAPPHCINFDNPGKLRSGRHTGSTSSPVPEVHVTIQNITQDGSSLVASSSAGVHQQPANTYPQAAIPTTDTPFLAVDSPITVAQYPNSPSPNLPVPSTSSLPSHPPAYDSEPPFAHLPNPSADLAASYRTSPDLSASSWGTPVPAVRGPNVFPPLSSVVNLLAAERPGPYWNQLEFFLREAGISSSEHILLADPTVLPFVGNMGPRQATTLRNFAKRVVLPVLGLHGTYQEDEETFQDESNTSHTRKRQLDLGEAVIHGLYKKTKLNPELADHHQQQDPGIEVLREDPDDSQHSDYNADLGDDDADLDAEGDDEDDFDELDEDS